MRELRHDFRAVYGVSYDDVPAGEAVDLVLTLPAGSLYRASLDPHAAWSGTEARLADLEDNQARMMQLYATGSTEGAPRLPRPWDARDAAAREAAQERARAKARDVKRRIEETEWREV